MAEVLKFGDDEWTVIGPIGEPTLYTEVFEVDRDGQRAVVKIVPKAPAGNRDLVVEQLGDVRNVLRFDEVSTEKDRYLLRMPMAEGSLFALRPKLAGEESEAVAVLRDIATALDDLGRVLVHRDIKPQNILRYQSAWYLADFGIARYIEEATAQYTFAGLHSKEWTAPERFIGERATIKSDVYSLGVVGYWLVTGGRLPFTGPDFFEQHRDTAPPPLPDTSPLLRALILEMLSKAPEARPTPAQILERLDSVNPSSPSPAVAKLHKLAGEYAELRSQADAAAAAAKTRLQKRRVVARSGMDTMEVWLDALIQPLKVPGVSRSYEGGVIEFSIGKARLLVHTPVEIDLDSPYDLPFDVVCAGAITVKISTAHGNRWAGRSHSLWYCDAKTQGDYSWFETGFSAIGRELVGIIPYAQAPDTSARRALSPGTGPEYVAVPFTPLVGAAVDAFAEKWIGWFVDAADDTLSMPRELTDGSPERTWRESSPPTY